MTCIAAIQTEDAIYMCADSAGVDGLSIATRNDKKVFIRKDVAGTEFGFGFTSSFRMGQLLQYSFQIPTLATDVDLQEYMSTKFISAVRTCLKEGGYVQVTNNRESAGTFLVGVRNRIFAIHGDFQVAEAAMPFNACGCGASLALGSLYSTHNMNLMGHKLEPEFRLRLALHAAQEYSAGVRSPFHYITVPGLAQQSPIPSRSDVELVRTEVLV